MMREKCRKLGGKVNWVFYYYYYYLTSKKSLTIVASMSRLTLSAVIPSIAYEEYSEVFQEYSEALTIPKLVVREFIVPIIVP